MQVILDETTAGWKLCDIRALLGAIFEDYLKVRGERVDEFSGRFGPIVPIRFVSTHSVASYAGRLTPPRSLIAGVIAAPPRRTRQRRNSTFVSRGAHFACFSLSLL